MKKYYISEDTYTLLVQTKAYGDYYYSLEEPKYFTGESREITEELYIALSEIKLDFDELSYNTAKIYEEEKIPIFLVECYDEETEESTNFFSITDYIPLEVEENWLKELREKNNFTQKELAIRTGVNIHTIQNIEQGKRKGSKETIKILNNFFNQIKRTEK